MMTLDKQREREAMGKNRSLGLGMSPMLMNSMGGGMGDPHMMGGMGMYHNNVQEYMRWSLLPIMPVGQPNVNPGCRSQERHVQAARESTTIAAFYHPAMWVLWICCGFFNLFFYSYSGCWLRISLLIDWVVSLNLILSSFFSMLSSFYVEIWLNGELHWL